MVNVGIVELRYLKDDDSRLTRSVRPNLWTALGAARGYSQVVPDGTAERVIWIWVHR